jgi:hypothetical protein
MPTANTGQHNHYLVYPNESPAVSPIPATIAASPPRWAMSLEITSVTYRRCGSRTILAIGRFSGFKTAKTAGGLRETLCPEMAFAFAGGRLFAG